MDRPPGYELAANPLVTWEIGEPKAPMYDSFTVVNSRKLDQESIDAGWYAQWQVRWERWWRERAAWRRVALGEVTINAARAEMGLPPFEWPVINPEPRYTVVSDVTLEGEEAAQALGLDDKWRAILGMPPKDPQ